MVIRYTSTDSAPKDEAAIPPLDPTERSGNGYKIFFGRIIHSKSPAELETLPRAAVGVRPDGTIAFVDTAPDSTTLIPEVSKARYPAFSKADCLVLKPSQFLFPGLIDTHLHAPQWPNLALGMDGTLREWIEKYTDPVEASYSDVDKARRVYGDVVATTLRLGSTTVAYNASMHVEATKVLVEECWRQGQRAVVGKMAVTTGSTKGNWEVSSKASLKGSREVIEYIRRLDQKARLLRPSVQPRGGPYCPPHLMAGLGKQSAEYGALVQGHMCETPDDIARTLALHPNFSCYTDMYRAYGLLHERSVQAHCIHLQPRDVENIKATGAGVAHCPNSNTVLRDGECRVRELLDAGIKVGLGTDCSAGYMPSILDAMRSASNISRHLALKPDSGGVESVLSFPELVYLATLGGAAVLGLEGKVGRFEAGMEFDALVVDVEGVVSVTPELWAEGAGREGAEQMVRKWVFLGDDRTVRRVFVGGREVGGWDA